VPLGFWRVEGEMKIAAAGAVENVGKAERFLRSFFQAPGGNPQEEVRRRRTLRFPQVRHFPQGFAPGEFSRFVVRKIEDTPPPLRINLTDC